MKSIITSTLILLLTMMVGGCGIYSGYKREETVDPDSLLRETSSSRDTASLSSLSWREIFRDPCLQELIDTGLARNTDLNIARLRVEEAQIALKASLMRFLPSLSLSPEIGGGIDVNDGASSRTYSIGASSNWEIDIFGKLRNEKESAKAAVMQSESYRQAVQTQLIASIAESYCSLLLLDRQLEITKRTISSWEENVRTMKALKAAGQYSEASVSQAEANKLKAETSVVTLEQSIHELENSLSVLCGTVPGSIERGTFGQSGFPESLSEGIPASSLVNRPDVRQAEYALAESFYAVNSAKAAFYPSLTLSGSLGWTNSTGATILDPAQWIANALGQMVQPVFNKGKNSANLKIAERKQSESRLYYTQCLLNAGAEVNDALTQWQASVKRLDLDKRQIDALNNTLRSTELLMMHGSTNYLEVLTAQQSLLNAELSAAASEFDQMLSVIRLYHALGGGSLQASNDEHHS